MAQSLASDSIHPSGKLPPTLTPTGHFAGKPTLPISRSVTLIGSRKQARLQLISSTVSQNHALIVNADSGPYIRDLASREHVYVNGQMVVESPLNEGDEIRIGRFTFKFNQSPNQRPTTREMEPAGPGQLDVDGSPVPIPIETRSVLIGRRDSCDVPLLEDSVSTTHAIIFEMDGRRFVRDLASRTGTFVNGKQVHQVELRPGDEIRVGETIMRYATDSAPGVTQDELMPADLGAEQSDLVSLEPAEPAAEIVPIEREPLEVEPEPVEAADMEVELEPVAQEQAAEAEVELEPVEAEAEVELELEPLSASQPPAEEAEIELAPQEMEPVAPSARAPEPVARAREPVARPPQPVAPSQPVAPPRTVAPVAPVAKAPPVAKVPPVAPPAAPKVSEPSLNLSWGANLEHFLGGMPLKLDPVPEKPRPAPTPQPAKVPPPAPQPVEPEPAPVRGEVDLSPIEPEPVPVRGEMTMAPGPLEVAEAPAPAPAETEPLPEPLEVEIAPESEFRGGPPAEPEPEIEVEPAPLAVEPPMPLEMATPQDVIEEPLAEAPVEEPFAEAPPVEEPIAEEAPAPVEETAAALEEAPPPVEEIPEPVEEAPTEVEATEEEPPPADEEEPFAEPPRVAAEVGSRQPADQILSDEVFQLADDTELERSAAATAVAELNFDATQAELEEQLGITPTFEDLAAPQFDDTAIAAPPVAAEGLEEIDFSAPPEEAAEPFVMPDESAFEMPPLDLGEGMNDTPVLPDSLFSVGALDLGAAGTEIVEEPSPVFGDVTAEAPVAPPPKSRKKPPPRQKAPPAAKVTPPRKKVAPPREELAPPAPVEPPVAKAPLVAEPPLDLAPPPVAEAPPRAQAPLELTPPPAEAPAAHLEPVAPPAEPPAAVEVISDTEATPESALELERAVSTEPHAETVEPVGLTDTGFGRAVDEFTTESTGPLIEQPEARATEPPAEPPVLEADDLPALTADDTLAADEAPPADSREKLFDLTSLAPAPIEEDVEIESLEAEPVAEAPAPTTEPQRAAEPGREMEIEAQEVELEPLADIDLAPLAPVEPESVAELPAAVEPEIEPIAEVELEPIAEVEPEPEPIAPPHPEAMPMVSAHDEGADTLMGVDVHVEPEPPPALDELTPADLEPIAEAPEPQAPQPTAPQAEPPQARPAAREDKPTPRQAAEDFNWGANQDQFYGGMPLKLTSPPRPQPTVVPPRPQPIGAPPREQPPTAPAMHTEPPRPRPKPPLFKKIAPDTFADAPPPRGGRGIGQPTSEIPPLAGKNVRPSQVSTGFDGLALPSNEVDVFSQQVNRPGGTADDVFGRRAIPAPPTGPNVPPGQRAPRRPGKAEAPGDVWTAHPVQTPELDTSRPAPSPPAPPTESPAPAEPPRKKRRWFGLKSLLFLMILLMAGAGAGIWFLFPENSVVTGTLRFERFDKLPHAKRLELEAEQRRLLAQEAIRTEARTKLVQIHRELAPGFINDPADYSRTVAGASLDPNKGDLTVKYVGAGTKDNQSRMLALMQALHALNRPKVDEAEGLQRTVASLTQTREETSKLIDEKKKQIAELEAIALPDTAERTKLEAEVAQLEAAFNAAVNDVARLKAELEQAQNGTQVAIPPPPGEQPAAPPADQPADEQLTQLRAELQKVNEQIAAIKESRPVKTGEARQQLQSVIDAFAKQVQQSQPIINSSADLQSYVAAAQKLIDSSRELTDQLVRRQQEQNERLAEHKTRLNDRMAQRRAQALQSDPQLGQLMEQHAFKTRALNAATGQELTPQATALQAELDELNKKIREREAAVPDSGLYGEEIDQLQKIVAQTQKQIDDDRTHTMAALDENQATFAKSHPAPANLAPEQKQLAGDVEKHLAQIAAARRQYADASDAAGKQADAQIAELQQNAADLASKVEARRVEVAVADITAIPPPPAPLPAQRDQLIEQKTAALAAAETTRAQAEAAFAAGNKKLLDLRNRIDQARAAGERRDALIRQSDIDNKLLLQLNNQLDLKKKEAEVAVAPIEPTQADIHLDLKPDERFTYIGIACGAVLVVFVGLIMLTGTGRTGSVAREYDVESDQSPRAGTRAAPAQF